MDDFPIEFGRWKFDCSGTLLMHFGSFWDITSGVQRGDPLPSVISLWF